MLQDKSKKKVHRGSRKPGEESIVQVDPDEDLSDYSNEYRIKQSLLRNYDKTTRPVHNDTSTTTLYVGMSLFHILDTVQNAFAATHSSCTNCIVSCRVSFPYYSNYVGGISQGGSITPPTSPSSFYENLYSPSLVVIPGSASFLFIFSIPSLFHFYSAVSCQNDSSIRSCGLHWRITPWL